MKEYVGIKRIKAEPMTRGEYNEYRGWVIPENENPKDEGYLVKYPDGYESWSPKNVFEEAYHELGTDLLIDSVLLMTSKDFKERFRAEYIQTAIRFNKILAFLRQWDEGQLDYEPATPRATFNFQIDAMSKYIGILETRAKIEGIKLFDN